MFLELAMSLQTASEAETKEEKIDEKCLLTQEAKNGDN